MIEEVVLLDGKNQPAGTMDKALVHTGQTPLHLAFSCYIHNDRGEILLTRRALSKVAWPGVWTNSVCGHPLPGESLRAAVCRRCQYELGLSVEQITSLVDEFQYRATDASGIVENEFCPIFAAFTRQLPVPRASEVMDYQWVKPEDLLNSVRATPWAFSPWMVLQLGQITQENLSLLG
ncbi:MULTISPECIES: isopentenyl-diphosphate Delta-isomerase [Rahnella]|jgi:isopentenyl-diphosphate delta-isomerase|uniref:Isopentenyl-diphosphate Delta-isomerase n=1 Tax=Rahnella sp. (strain Y9602) TaxID=2703885 RepID=A0A0H3FMK6_RAHSY|nr:MULTISPECIES: isopentenyl-diphosphate Delta-isomerase [Rahnella]AFE60896.1 isopentenyl-diphosphate delta-isomerase [Rahnella aquatilis HX2]MDP9705421.1 isopentenyl-diphosphate delta-isomerase [Rahnella aquatilis]ADW76218.1 isopentenyl-diphosphate delta-isomerase, type 1 [Rahnella aceris]MBU9842658.1 isopentenyl-diphosphate Delta-isomerase [Rahnella aceris]MBU9850465.1 isopentenyl-diphosphate Delta-isomerase [Rahnella aceris]